MIVKLRFTTTLPLTFSWTVAQCGTAQLYLNTTSTFCAILPATAALVLEKTLMLQEELSIVVSIYHWWHSIPDWKKLQAEDLESMSCSIRVLVTLRAWCVVTMLLELVQCWVLNCSGLGSFWYHWLSTGHSCAYILAPQIARVMQDLDLQGQLASPW